ncbi:uncharacterized protein LOC135813832 isoform X1 [Sycon ciliatum]|uniref:uncharacterized protein LOC135813832 isoform X1 n=1 Tax=Sycon ciliatum TaxID=27933 RepID=UPI0031F5F1D8
MKPRRKGGSGCLVGGSDSCCTCTMDDRRNTTAGAQRPWIVRVLVVVTLAACCGSLDGVGASPVRMRVGRSAKSKRGLYIQWPLKAPKSNPFNTAKKCSTLQPPGGNAVGAPGAVPSAASLLQTHPPPAHFNNQQYPASQYADPVPPAQGGQAPPPAAGAEPPPADPVPVDPGAAPEPEDSTLEKGAEKLRRWKASL